jgi:hypothetical protein
MRQSMMAWTISTAPQQAFVAARGMVVWWEAAAATVAAPSSSQFRNHRDPRRRSLDGTVRGGHQTRLWCHRAQIFDARIGRPICTPNDTDAALDS